MKFYLKSILKFVIDTLIYVVLMLFIVFYNHFQISKNILLLIGIGVGVRAVIRLIFNIYQDLSLYSGVLTVGKLGLSTFIAYVIQWIVAKFIFQDSQVMELSRIVISLILLVAETFLLISYRYWRRIVRTITQRAKNNINTLVIGAGEGAKIVLDEITNNKAFNNKVIGFIDDDDSKQRKYYRGYRVLGKTENIEEIIVKRDIKEIIISTVKYPSAKFKEILDIANNNHVVLKKIGLIAEEGIFKVKELSIDELLNREAVQFSTAEINENLEGKVVLVTGAGGSIGSELCRQIFDAKPKMLVLFDIYENSTYDIQLELIEKSHKTMHTEIITIIGSTYNEKRINNVFEKYKPEIIFHAAAYKHVPLMEENPVEALRTNIIGTYNVAKAAHENGSKKMLLVSTDKAVRPTNVMGATKRFAEKIIQYFSSISTTSFCAVRFGNVLGSNGSVVPLFRKQIENGGPITITHPDINRFFMTIPEAVSLILQASTYAKKGEIFILDMGEPVKIIDLARKMVVQAGFIPEVDIKFEYIGLRPGEKLYEEILLDTEKHLKTPNQKIFIEKPESVDPIDSTVNNLSKVIDTKDEVEIKKMLAGIVDTYTIQK